jgi:hypothetical protein
MTRAQGLSGSEFTVMKVPSMRVHLVPILALTALAGCVQSTSTPATMTAPATMPVATLAPTDADRATPAYRACVAAIAGQTGKSQADVAVFQYLFSEAGTQVEATVAGADAPWRCLAANDGTVQSVMFTGSEGNL